MKLLYLSEWYPHRYDAMAGLFVRKHAEAVVRQGVEVCVLYCHLDKNIHHTEIVEQTTNGVREIYVYYPSNFLAAISKGYATVKQRFGMPDICQLNVITKNGLLPLYLKLVHHIPYVIVEHWSGYLPQNFSIHGGWHKRLMQLICRQAHAVLPVSQMLEDAMRANGFTNSHFQRIHNVVDDFFYPSSSLTPCKSSSLSSSPTSILHVSCFDEKAKNIRGLLRAVRRIADQRQGFTLTLVGTGIDFDSVRAYTDSLHFPAGIICFTGEQTPEQVAEHMRAADFFLLFSRYETYGIVLAEAAAIGIPCLYTNTTGLQLPADCGITVPSEDESALAEQILYLLDHHTDFDPACIRKHGQQYSYDAVGKQLLEIYQRALISSH